MKVYSAVSAGLFCFFIQTVTPLQADGQRQVPALTWREGHSNELEFRATERIPGASGEGTWTCDGDRCEIELEFAGMKPAWLFRGDYTTYVVWVLSPKAEIVNAGELVLDGDRASIRVSANFGTLAIVVTAEPHYLVTVPSGFVVLENEPVESGSTIQYPVLQGVYNFERTTLEGVKSATGRVHTEVKQAIVAVRLARRAGADVYAGKELSEAESALDQALDLLQRVPRIEAEMQARRTIRLAVAAQRQAENRASRDARVGGEPDAKE